jgi:hypothetical protein
MRVLAIWIALACLFGCEDRYGTYIRVRAGSKELRFDRLELYYGVRIGTQVPTTPKHAMPEPDNEPQLLLARAFAPSDVQMFGSLRDEYTVWIPDGGQNDALGAYVLAIGYAGGQRVGIGELFDFDVTDERKVYIYSMTLDALPSTEAIEEWGRGQTTCLRIQRPRPEGMPVVVAMVDQNDSDCDRFLDRSSDGMTDCEPLRYCDGSGTGGCLGKTACVDDADTCSVGSCSNKDGAPATCETQTCVSDALCSSCDLTEPAQDILECALLAPSTHPGQDFAVITHGSERLCSDPTILDIALPFPCANPTIDAVAYFQDSEPFDFTVEPGPQPNVCRVKIYSTTDDHFSGVPHLLLGVDLAPPRRLGFVLGLIANGGSCPDPGEAQEGTYEPDLGDCDVPSSPLRRL